MENKIKYWCNCYESTKKFINDRIDNCNKLLEEYIDIENNQILYDYAKARLNTYIEIQEEMKKIEKENM